MMEEIQILKKLYNDINRSVPSFLGDWTSPNYLQERDYRGDRGRNPYRLEELADAVDMDIDTVIQKDFPSDQIMEEIANITACAPTEPVPNNVVNYINEWTTMADLIPQHQEQPSTQQSLNQTTTSAGNGVVIPQHQEQPSTQQSLNQTTTSAENGVVIPQHQEQPSSQQSLNQTTTSAENGVVIPQHQELPSSQQSLNQTTTSGVELALSEGDPFIGQGLLQVHSTDNQSLFVPQSHLLNTVNAPCLSTEAVCEGLSALSQILPDFLSAPLSEPLPPQYSVTSSHQQQQHYTTASAMNIQCSVDQAHPDICQGSQNDHFVAQNGQSGGTANKKTRFNTADEENLPYVSAAGNNGSPSKSAQNINGSYKNNSTSIDPPNNKSNRNNSQTNRGNREYTEEELEKMRKNNEASKRSREKRRIEERAREHERKDLEDRNRILKEKLDTLRNAFTKANVQMLTMFSIITQRQQELIELSRNSPESEKKGFS